MSVFFVLFCFLITAEPYSNDERERNQKMVEFIRNINTNIQPFHLEVKKGICEEDGTNFYCLVILAFLRNMLPLPVQNNDS